MVLRYCQRDDDRARFRRAFPEYRACRPFGAHAFSLLRENRSHCAEKLTLSTTRCGYPGVSSLVDELNDCDRRNESSSSRSHPITRDPCLAKPLSNTKRPCKTRNGELRGQYTSRGVQRFVTTWSIERYDYRQGSLNVYCRMHEVLRVNSNRKTGLENTKPSMAFVAQSVKHGVQQDRDKELWGVRREYHCISCYRRWDVRSTEARSKCSMTLAWVLHRRYKV